MNRFTLLNLTSYSTHIKKRKKSFEKFSKMATACGHKALVRHLLGWNNCEPIPYKNIHNRTLWFVNSVCWSVALIGSCYKVKYYVYMKSWQNTKQRGFLTQEHLLFRWNVLWTQYSKYIFSYFTIEHVESMKANWIMPIFWCMLSHSQLHTWRHSSETSIQHYA